MKKIFILLIVSFISLQLFSIDDFEAKAAALFEQYQPKQEVIFENNITPEESWEIYYREMNGRDPLMISTMPSNDVNFAYGNALINQSIAIWGSARGGTAPYDWKIYINNTVVDSGSTTNGRYIGTDYTFIYTGLKTIKLEVTDAASSTDFSESVVRAYPSLNQTIEVNMAIEKGLLYLYKNAVIYNTDYIYWGYSNSDGGTAATGMSILAFEENGHIPINDYQNDIYAETTRMGLNHLLTQSANTYNGHAYLRNNQYANGIGWLALIMSHPDAASALSDNITIGPFTGMNFYTLVESCMDMYELNQGNSGEWHYTVATTNSSGYDGSCHQWPIFVMKAAEDRWGIFPDAATHTAAMNAYAAITNANGACGYGSSNQYLNSAKTGGMLVGYIWDGKLQSLGDPQAIQSINYIGTKWYNLGHQVTYPGWVADFYAMYGVKKGLELQGIETISTPNGDRYWYDDMVDWLLGHSTDFTTTFSSGYRTTSYAFGQKTTGGWQSAYGYVNSHGPSGDHLDTAHAILVLTKAVTTIVPVAVISGVHNHLQNTSFQLSAANSYHPDPTKTIVEWLWDWDASDGIDWNSPDATGLQPTNPGYADMDDYTITLRVKDDNVPPRYDADTFVVTITSDNLPPVAVAIPDSLLPSYAGFVGQPITLDGSQSFDPNPEDSITVWSWDTDGDGNFGDEYGETVDVTFPGEYVGSVGLEVTSSDGTTGVSSAYIDIAYSGTDIFVDDFITYRMLDNSTELHLEAYLKNDINSSVDEMNVLVQFYNDNPFTIGQRVGGNYYVDLPIGVVDTLDLTLTVPLGLSQIYVFLDANQNVVESNELNNIASQPIAYGFGFDDDVTMNEDIITVFNVFNNDYSGDGPLEITSITQPAYGTSEIVDTLLGTIRYTPTTQNYNGLDSFTYQIDTPMGPDPVDHTVSITIDPINDPPVCTVLPTISGNSIIGETVTSTPSIWNDDIDDIANTVTLSYQWQTADDDLFTVNVINIAGANADNYVLDQPERNRYLRLKVTGTDDGTPLPAQTLDVYSNVIYIQNNIPIITEGDLLQLFTDEDVDISFTLEVTDLDANETFSWNFMQQPNLGQINYNSSSRNSETANFTYYPNNDEFGLDSLYIEVSDGIDSDTIRVTIDITPVNDAPILNITGTFATDEDLQSQTYDFSQYCSQTWGENDVLTLTADNSTHIDVTINGFDVIFESNLQDWFGSEDIIFYLDDNVSDSIVRRSTSERNSTKSKKQNSIDVSRDIVQQTISVTVNPINDPPLLNITGTFLADEDLPSQIYDFTSFCSQVWGETDPLTLSAANSAHIDVTITGFDVVFESNTSNWNGTESITFYLDDNVTDGRSSRDIVEQTIQVTVNPINDPPSIVLPDDFTFDEDSNLVEDFTSYISDIEPDNLTLSYTGNTDIIVSIVGFEVTFSAPADWFGSETINFTVDDNVTDLTATDDVLVIVDPVNDPPILNITGTFETDEDLPSVTYDFSQYCSQTWGETDNLTLTADNSTHVDVTISGFDVIFESNMQDWFGSEDITFYLDDNINDRSRDIVEQIISVTVNPVNDPPILSITGTFEADEDLPSQTYDFSQYCSQTWGETDVLTLSSTNSDHIDVTINDFNVIFESNTLNWNGTEDVTFYLDDNVTVMTDVGRKRKVDHQNTGRDIVEQTVSVTINPVNDPPSIVLPDDFTFDEDDSLVEDFTNYVSDIEPDNLTLSYTGNTDIIVSIAGLEVTFSATADWFGSETITFTVDDNVTDLTATDDVIVIVTPVNDPPELISYTPDDLLFTVTQDSIVSFEVIAEDIDSDLDYEWYIDSVIQTENTNLFNYQFTDIGIVEVKSIVSDTEYDIETIWEVTVEPGAGVNNIPIASTQLYDCYPNPFNPETTIQFDIKNGETGILQIFNVKGQVIVNKEFICGQHSFKWNASNCSSGLYFYQLKTGEKFITKKMLMLK